MAEAKKKKKIDKEKVQTITPTFRVSYPALFKPQGDEGKEKYSVTMLFPKDTDISKIKKIIKNAKIAEFGADESEWPKLRSPIRDGDHEDFADKEGYEGMWVIRASSIPESKPGLVDKDGEHITSPSEFYPGCFARAQIFAKCYEYMGKRGVQIILDHVQKMKDGKAFSSKKPVEQVFGPVNSGDEDESEQEESFL